MHESVLMLRRFKIVQGRQVVSVRGVKCKKKKKKKKKNKINKKKKNIIYIYIYIMISKVKKMK